MSNDSAHMLNRYFADLATLLADSQPKSSCALYDGLMQQTLRILGVLVNEDLCEEIGMQFSLLLKSEAPSCAETKLRDEFALVDDCLEEHLRGFSNLLDFVLEDARVSHDATFLLDAIDEDYAWLKPPFVDGAAILLCYLDICDSFEFEAPHAAAALALWVMEQVVRDHDEIISQGLTDWLNLRASDTELADLYRSGVIQDVSISERAMSKNWLMIFLCIKAARSEYIHEHEVARLDRALHEAGMLGIHPFIESGFLALAEDARKTSVLEQEAHEPTFLRIVKA